MTDEDPDPVRVVLRRGHLEVVVEVRGLATDDDVQALPAMLARSAHTAVRWSVARRRDDEFHEEGK